MKSEFEIAITQLSADRNLAPEVILEAIEAALESAYKRNFGASQNVDVTISPRTGQAVVSVKKVVVETVEDDRNEISLAMATTFDATAELGDFVDVEVKPRNFGRIAAQTAKQVITQRIREAERDSVYLEYADRVGEIINATIRSIDGRSRNVVMGLGKAEALMPRSEQIQNESYRIGQRLRVYVTDVERGGHGPQIIVSRTERGLLKRLLELEVPEIYAGTVEIKAIAREPGSRSKVAVFSSQPGVDPVGSCVGMRGVRVQNIVNELNGEKIDVVSWDAKLEAFIANALSPAKVVAVYLNSEYNTAKVVVPERSLSLAIGKEGQNARLAAKLTGWRIDIKSEEEAAAEAEQLALEAEQEAQRQAEMAEQRRAAAELLAAAEASLDEAAADAVDAEVGAGDELDATTSTDDATTSTDDATTSTDDATTSTDDATTSTDDATTRCLSKISVRGRSILCLTRTGTAMNRVRKSRVGAAIAVSYLTRKPVGWWLASATRQAAVIGLTNGKRTTSGASIEGW